MDALFLKLLNMSITASWLILAVVVLRLVLKKAPKWMSCALWALVALRLLFPFSFESVFSLIPSAETVSPDIIYDQTPGITSGIPAINSAVNPIISGSFSPEMGASVNPLQIWTAVVSYVWLAGVAAMLLYAVFSYLRLRRRVKASILVRDNIWICDDIQSPFILGVLKPRIYLPSGMEDAAVAHVLAHENAHLQRRDHLWKPLGFALLAVYWFNPLCWLAYILLCRDIELACDEKVIRSMEKPDMIAYSEALLSCSLPRRMVMACPLAFGELGVKERIKTVLNYKKPAFWIIIVAVVVCVVVAVCFLTDPQADIDIENAVSAHVDGYMVSDDAAAELVSMLNNNKGTAFPVGADDPNSRSVTVQIICTDGGFYVLHYQYYRGISFDAGTDDYRSILTWFDSEDKGQPAWAQKSWKLDDGFDEKFRLWYDAAMLEKSTSASQTLSLNDIIILSGKGEALTWSDFDAYAYTETGSGLYIRVYEIDEQFSLWIGGGPTDEPPMYIRLVSEANSDAYIDIRTEDVEAFIAEHSDSVSTVGGADGPTLIIDSSNTYMYSVTVYMNPIGSYFPVGTTGYLYKIDDHGSLTIVNEETGEIFASVSNPDAEWSPLTADEWKALFVIGDVPDISGIHEPLVMRLSDKYNLFDMDGGLWLGEYNGDKNGMWSVYALAPYQPKQSPAAADAAQTTATLS